MEKNQEKRSHRERERTVLFKASTTTSTSLLGPTNKQISVLALHREGEGDDAGSDADSDGDGDGDVDCGTA